MATDTDCLFCKISEGEIPASVVHADDAALSFLDVGPLCDGHILLMPRRHYANLTDMPRDLSAHLGGLLPRLGRALLTVTGADGFNVLVNNAAAAGQVVMHVHWHLIPRRADDALGYRWNAGTYAEGRMAELAEAYGTALRPAGA